MKEFVIGIAIISAILTIFLFYNPCHESYYPNDYCDSDTIETSLLNCIKIERCTVENTNHVPFHSISYRFIDLKKHDIPKKIKKESKYKPICNKLNLDGKEMMKNAPYFLSHLHFATSEPNADRGCKNKFI